MTLRQPTEAITLDDVANVIPLQPKSRRRIARRKAATVTDIEPYLQAKWEEEEIERIGAEVDRLFAEYRAIKRGGHPRRPGPGGGQAIAL
jgi:hypothetical protein